jgi:tetrahydromethanopterin S-methyltransferase subunit B
MVDYKEMYSILFNKMTDIIEEIQQVQRQTEEMYIHSMDPEFILLKSVKNLEQPEKKE